MEFKHPIEILNGVMLLLEKEWERLSNPYTYVIKEELARVENRKNIYSVKHLIQEDTCVEGDLMDGEGDIVIYKQVIAHAQYTLEECTSQLKRFGDSWELVKYMRQFNYTDQGDWDEWGKVSWYTILHNQDYVAMDNRLAKSFYHVPFLGKYGNICRL